MAFAENNTLKYTRLHDVDVEISTVFLGYDTAKDSPESQKGRPLIFETMVFGGVLNKERRLYRDFDEAILGHHDVCHAVAHAEAQYTLMTWPSKIKGPTDDPQP